MKIIAAIEDDFTQQHFEMNPQEHEVRTSLAGNFDNFNQSADQEF